MSNKSTCIACSNNTVEQFLDLGVTALANQFVTAEQAERGEPTFPLRVGYCHECSHVQLVDHVSPEAMFAEYLYVSSVSTTLTAHLKSVAAMVATRFSLGPDDFAIDVGSNDGTLLTGYKEFGVKTLGVDPAKNLAELARKSGIETFTDFFGEKTAHEIRKTYGPASVVTATNSFPHIPELDDYLMGIEHVLAPGGVFILEAHYLMDMIETRAFDTVYHEHFSYWSLKPMQRLMKRHGLVAFSAEHLDIHHGQLRVFIGREGEQEPDETIAAIVQAEEEKGIPGWDTCKKFADDAAHVKSSLDALLADLKSKGNTIAGYGAPAKGNTLLSFLGIGPDRLPYIADQSPLKQGLFTPGHHIPVVSPDRITEENPDYLLLLAWNFAEEIADQQHAFRESGGKFIVPIPEPAILD